MFPPRWMKIRRAWFLLSVVSINRDFVDTLCRYVHGMPRKDGVETKTMVRLGLEEQPPLLPPAYVGFYVESMGAIGVSSY